MLKMQDVSKLYRTELVETRALSDFCLEVDEGEFVTITGPSGCGKTTFLNIAGLLETYSSGTYLLDGQEKTVRMNDDPGRRIRIEDGKPVIE